MKSSAIKLFSIAIISVFVLIGCKDKGPQFTIQGKISDADSTTLYLERRSLKEKTVIDSIQLDKDGSFKFEESALTYNEFYTLKLSNQIINLSVDSTETITVNASKPTFATEYTLEGSKSSLKMKEVTLGQYEMLHTIDDLNKQLRNKSLSEEEYVQQIQQAIFVYKEKAEGVITSDFRDPAAYFAIFQKVGDYLIFDPYEKKDRSLFQAVATTWDQFRPNSPRSAHIRDFTLAAIAESKKQAQQAESFKNIKTSEVNSLEYFNVELPGKKGEKVSLASLKGKVVILDFTAYGSNFSPAHNIALNNVYTKHKGAVEIYQISFDNDNHIWQNSATNLPWITVRDDKSLDSQILPKFNVQNLPTTFLLDKQGNIVKRILGEDNLDNEVKKIL